MSKSVSLVLSKNSKQAKEVSLELEAVPANKFLDNLRIALDKPLCMEFENSFLISPLITQRLYEDVMGSNPSLTREEDAPVNSITWEEAQTFCRKLDNSVARMSVFDKFLKLIGMAKPIIRLPSEAELAYAYIYLNDPNLFSEMGEWCADVWHETDNLVNAPTDGSAWVNDGTKKFKTVSFIGKPIFSQISGEMLRRKRQHKDSCSFQVGFRIAMTL